MLDARLDAFAHSQIIKYARSEIKKKKIACNVKTKTKKEKKKKDESTFFPPYPSFSLISNRENVCLFCLLNLHKSRSLLDYVHLFRKCIDDYHFPWIESHVCDYGIRIAVNKKIRKNRKKKKKTVVKIHMNINKQDEMIMLIFYTDTE